MNDSCLEKCYFMQHVYTGTPHFIILHFIAFHRYYMFVCFLKLKVCGNPALSKSISAIFPTFAHFVPPCHGFWQFLQYFKLFYLYLLW